MTTLHLLALAGYFLILFEYIAMRHRDICAESDARISAEIDERCFAAVLQPTMDDWHEAFRSQCLYFNRGTK